MVRPVDDAGRRRSHGAGQGVGRRARRVRAAGRRCGRRHGQRRRRHRDLWPTRPRAPVARRPARPPPAPATGVRGPRHGGDRDPRDGEPARGLLSATVVGPDLGTADALATGLLAAEREGFPHLLAGERYAARVTGAAGVVWVSPGFPPTSAPASGEQSLSAGEWAADAHYPRDPPPTLRAITFLQADDGARTRGLRLGKPSTSGILRHLRGSQFADHEPFGVTIALFGTWLGTR